MKTCIWLVSMTERHDVSVEASSKKEAIDRAMTDGFGGTTHQLKLTAKRVAAAKKRRGT